MHHDSLSWAAILSQAQCASLQVVDPGHQQALCNSAHTRLEPMMRWGSQLGLLFGNVVMVHPAGGSVLQGWKHSISQITK
jgi:hypothetical protein